ncbi:MAG: DUF4395 domain-containing protein [Saprospiraceae bacterium]|nr:DUF4395 domain-containing protein [Saprospiraceae bacterium]MCB9325389.1 DUF4395 domain-containing protein [Lewinellaceae bacterium]
MSLISFGEYIEGRAYKVLDERIVRGSAGILLFLAVIASINGFILKNYIVVPYISGFLALNFLIGIFINPKFSPTMFISWVMVKNQSPLPIGAIQKKFAWSLGLVLSTTIFILSLFLLSDESYFDPVCLLCLTCIGLLFLETAFGICMGCKLYHLSVYLKLIKPPKEKPNCMGDACDTDV